MNWKTNDQFVIPNPARHGLDDIVHPDAVLTIIEVDSRKVYFYYNDWGNRYFAYKDEIVVPSKLHRVLK